MSLVRVRRQLLLRLGVAVVAMVISGTEIVEGNDMSFYDEVPSYRILSANDEIIASEFGSGSQSKVKHSIQERAVSSAPGRSFSDDEDDLEGSGSGLGSGSDDGHPPPSDKASTLTPITTAPSLQETTRDKLRALPTEQSITETTASLVERKTVQPGDGTDWSKTSRTMEPPGVLHKTKAPEAVIQQLYSDDQVKFESLNWRENISLPYKTVSDTWAYAKEHYGISREKKLSIIFKNMTEKTYSGCTSDSARDLKDYTLICTPSPADERARPNISVWFKHKIFSNIGAMALKGVTGVTGQQRWPGYNVSELSIASIIVYDVLLGIGNKGEAADWTVMVYEVTKTNERFLGLIDWYLKIYEKYGNSRVLRKFFGLLNENWPREGSAGARGEHGQLNMGEWVHFWSTAAGENLEELAEKCFDWSQNDQLEYENARETLQDLKYSCTDSECTRKSENNLTSEKNATSDSISGSDEGGPPIFTIIVAVTASIIVILGLVALIALLVIIRRKKEQKAAEAACDLWLPLPEEGNPGEASLITK